MMKYELEHNNTLLLKFMLIFRSHKTIILSEMIKVIDSFIGPIKQKDSLLSITCAGYWRTDKTLIYKMCS